MKIKHERTTACIRNSGFSAKSKVSAFKSATSHTRKPLAVSVEPTLTKDNKIKFDNNEKNNFNNFDTCDNLSTRFCF